MKIFFPIYLLLSLLLLTQCNSPSSEYNKRETHHTEITHDYNAPKSNGDDAQTTKLEHSENRDIWQKPNLVINLLGDLKGKVVADIGAGPFGYFSIRLAAQTDAEKIIAIDIEQKAIDNINMYASMLPEAAQQKLKTRLVPADNPLLKSGEADVVLIVNTCMYFENRPEYFRAVKKGIAPGGRLIILDHKKRNTPVGPPVSARIALGQLEQELLQAGYKKVTTDDTTLAYQYIVVAQ